MESVFGDVPYRAGFKHIDTKRLEGRMCSTLVLKTDFRLLDLSKVALRGLGIPPVSLSTLQRRTTQRHALGTADVFRPPPGSGLSLVFTAR